MTFLILNPENKAQHHILLMLNEMVEFHHTNSDNPQTDTALLLSHAATLCISHHWATYPTLQGYRPQTHGVLAQRWQMTEADFGPNFSQNIRIRDKRAMCKLTIQHEGLAYFSRSLSKRFLPVCRAMLYRMMFEVANDDPSTDIESLHLFDFMLALCNEGHLNTSAETVIHWALQIEEDIQKLDRLEFTPSVYEMYLNTAFNILHLGAWWRFQNTPSNLPGLAWSSDITEGPPQ